MRKKILVGIPSNLLNMVDQTADAECRTRSDLVREALRRYIDEFHKQRLMLNDLQRLENSFASSDSSIVFTEESANGVSLF